jgi:hypothetical protein
MVRIIIAQRTVDAKIIEMVMTFDEHKQKIRNEIDMQRNMAALFDAILEDAINKLDKLNRKAKAIQRNVYGLELEVAFVDDILHS